MKSILILGMTLIGFTNINAQKDCNRAFSAANYSVAHSNNAYEANNIYHTQEWTQKAMETFNEVETIAIECGCQEVSDLAYEGYEAASKAQEQNTWERSRFYAKRASQKARLMIEALAEFTNNDVADIESVGFEDREYVSNDNNIDNYYNNEDIESEKANRNLEIKEQLAVKLKADAAILKISEGYQSLADALGCKHAYEMAKSSYEITKEEINNTNLSETKIHYTLELNKVAEKAMLNFSKCADSF